MNKAVFLDRDGVINRKAPEDDYVVRWDQFDLLPGVVEAIRTLNQAAYRVIVVTNQRAIAKNRITISELESIHRKLMEKLGEHSATIDGIYFCPHDLESECGCRKPKPGMLLRALDDFAIDPQLSWMVGDSAVDIAAGSKAGCRTVLIGSVSNGLGIEIRADFRAGDLYQAVQMILRLV